MIFLKKEFSVLIYLFLSQSVCALMVSDWSVVSCICLIHRAKITYIVSARHLVGVTHRTEFLFVYDPQIVELYLKQPVVHFLSIYILGLEWKYVFHDPCLR